MKNLNLILTILFLATHALAKTQVAITVDDLPEHSKLPPGVSRLNVATQMLEVLKKEKIPEVYGFINAKKLEDSPEMIDVLKLWRKYGYPLGNHTFSHPDIKSLTEAEFEDNIQKNEPTLKDLNGDLDWKYFRYPFLREGETLSKREGVRKYLFDHGYKVAHVTIDFEDWSWNNPYARCVEKNDTAAIQWLKTTYLKNSVDQLERAKILSQKLYGKSIAHILLLHIGAFDAQMISQLIKSYKKHGVEFVPLSQALKDDVYAYDPQVVGPYGSELTYQVMKARGLTLKDLGMESYGENYPEKKLEELCPAVNSPH